MSVSTSTIETTIATLQAQLKEAMKQERKYYLRVQRNYPKMAIATTFEEYNKAAAKIDERHVANSILKGEMKPDSRKHFLNKFWEYERPRQAFARQAQDTLTREIYAYKCLLH